MKLKTNSNLIKWLDFVYKERFNSVCTIFWAILFSPIFAILQFPFGYWIRTGEMEGNFFRNDNDDIIPLIVINIFIIVLIIPFPYLIGVDICNRFEVTNLFYAWPIGLLTLFIIIIIVIIGMILYVKVLDNSENFQSAKLFKQRKKDRKNKICSKIEYIDEYKVKK